MTDSRFIPEDLILNIILRLPVQYVIVCRSVCKKWNFMLRSHNFISLYDNYRACRKENYKENGSSFILLRFDTELYKGYTNSMLPHQFPDVLISFLTVKKKCNELIATVDKERKADVPFSSAMITNLRRSYHSHSFRLNNVYNGIICMSNEMDIVLVNPSTRESQRLPFSPFSYPDADLTDSYVLGVWFDHHQSNSNLPPQGSLKHYKVFRAVILLTGQLYHYYDEFEDINIVFEIYDSRENCWRKSKTMCEYMSSWNHLLFNGVFHLPIVDKHNSLITLDAKSEMLGSLPLPSEINLMFNNAVPLYNLRGSLALLVDIPTSLTDIWLMNEYGVKQSWTKQYTIEFDVTLNQLQCRPITFWKYMDKEEEEDELFLQNTDGKLVSINLVTKKITNFELYGIPNSMMIVPYIETLLPL
ncbi:F-box protein At3g07870-like [Impatiens glandulifera]|uniref:F-box protein At3g07870-like n=1 Tax=Impatiens glandulifera TaxID=253017 RepID=UPI001FB1A210|nr:F-box protein At3g07870-like [Impatiens glandulifera]